MVKKRKVVLKMGGKLVHKAEFTPAGVVKFVRKARELGKEGAKGVVEITTPGVKKKRIVKF